MASIDGILRERGVRVVAVTFTPPGLVKAFLAENPLPFPIVSDPSRDGYKYFHLKRATIASFFKPRVLFGYLKRLFAGVKPRKPVDADLLQLGGDFLFDADGDVVWSWASKDATDRPTASQLAAAVERFV